MSVVDPSIPTAGFPLMVERRYNSGHAIDGPTGIGWSSDGVNTYEWDYENRMKSITDSVSATYKYDYQGRRTSKTVAGTTTTYLYDGLNLITEAGPTPTEYVFGPGIDEPLALSRGGNVSYYSVDGLGLVAIVSNPSGTVQNHYLYDAWGSRAHRPRQLHARSLPCHDPWGRILSDITWDSEGRLAS